MKSLLFLLIFIGVMAMPMIDAELGYTNPFIPKINPNPPTVISNGTGGGGANVTSVTSGDNCIIVNPNTGAVIITLNTSCTSLGVKSFLALNDTPDSYAGQAGKIVTVNSSESGLQFSNASVNLFANVTSVNSTTNCITVNPNTGDVLITFNTSCGGSGVNTTGFIPYELPLYNANFSQFNFTNFSYIKWGPGDQAGIHYDGTNLIVDPKISGSGYIDSNGADAKIDQIGIVGSAPSASGGVTGTTTSGTITSLYQGTLTYTPSVPTPASIFSGTITFNSTSSIALPGARGATLTANLGSNFSSSGIASIYGLLSQTGMSSPAPNITQGTANFYSVSGSFTGLGSQTHQGGTFNSYMIYGARQPALFSGLLGTWNYWAGYFDDAVQITQGMPLYLTGSPGTIGTNYLIGQVGVIGSNYSSVRYFINNSIKRDDNYTRTYYNNTQVYENNTKIVFEGNENYSGTSFLRLNSTQAQGGEFEFYLKNNRRYAANISRSYVAGDLVTDSNKKLVLEGSSTAEGDSYLTYTNAPATRSDIELAVDNSAAMNWNTTTRVWSNNTFQVNSDAKIMLEGSKTALGDTYLSMNSSSNNNTLMFYLDNNYKESKNGTRTWFNGTVQHDSDAKLILEGGLSAEGDSYLTFSSATSEIRTFVNAIGMIFSNTTRTYLNGSVGVNQFAPQATLDINGDTKARGDVNISIKNLNFIDGGNSTNSTYVTTKKITALFTNTTMANITVKSGAGGGADATIYGGDLAGIFQVRTNGVPLSNTEVARVQYRIPCNTNSSSVVLQAANSTTTTRTGQWEVVVDSNKTGFRVISGGTALDSLGDYRWYYHVICTDQYAEFDSAFNP